MDSDSPKTVAELIDAFGGPTAFSKVIGKRQSTASEMKRSGSIDARYWRTIINAAVDRGLPGVTADALVTMHAAPHPVEADQ